MEARDYPVLVCMFLSLLADTALVRKKANLRKDPSARHAPIQILLPDDELTILDSASSPRYLKVKTDDKKTGWVWKNAVEVLPETTNPVVIAPPGTPGISPDWDKPEAIDEDFDGSEGTCPGTGDGGDTQTNARKNRIDPLPPPHDVPWSAIASLPYPVAPTSRAKWKASQLAVIQPYEGVALRTTGFLTHKTNVEDTGSGESTNCHFHSAGDVDWHVYLQSDPGDDISKAVIVEVTPRIRKLHNWDVSVLDKQVGSGKLIRVTGFLMLDPEHRAQVGKYRGTVWEIHPITNIEVCNSSVRRRRLGVVGSSELRSGTDERKTMALWVDLAEREGFES